MLQLPSVVILFHATVKIYFSMTQQYFIYNSKLVSIYNMFITWKHLFTKHNLNQDQTDYSMLNNFFVQQYKGKVTMENYWKPKELATQKQHSLQSKDQRLYHYKRARALTWKQIIQQEEWSDRRMEPTIKPALHLVFL